MKGSDMSVARITMLDYIGGEAAAEIEAAFWEISPQIISEDDALKLVCNSATSGLSIAIYKT